MNLFIDDEKNPANDKIWTNFVEDSEQENQGPSQTEKIPPMNIIKIANTSDHVPVQKYFSQEISELDKTQKPTTKIENICFDQIFQETQQISQDRNTPKFLNRLFLQYHSQYTSAPSDNLRIIDVQNAFFILCQKKQAKITLDIQRYLFKESPYSRRNRNIFYSILKNQEILEKQLYGNGNVKNKKQYLHAVKVMRLRCRSGKLAERAQTR